MPAENNFIVAIELGSSKVVAIAGRKEPDGAIKVLASIQENASTFVSKGCIFNVDKMTQCLRNIKTRLEEKLNKNISKVYVGFGGMGIHSVRNKVERHYSEQEKITEEVIQGFQVDNLRSVSSDRHVFEVIAQEYQIGTQQTLDPKGVMSNRIEGNFLNIIGRPSIYELVRNCFEKADIPIADMRLSTLQMGQLMLTDAEKQSGCVFIDLGSETTTVAVYRHKILRHFAILPLGSNNITRDIMSLQIQEDEAEELKRRYGLPTEEDEEKTESVTLRDGRNIAFSTLSGLIEARVEEIVCNVAHQIALSNYSSNELIGGLIITGGGACLKNIDRAFAEHTKFPKRRFMPTLKVQTRGGGSDFNRTGVFNAALAAVDAGKENCCGDDKKNDDLFGNEQQDAHTPQPIIAGEGGEGGNAEGKEPSPTPAPEPGLKPKEPGKLSRGFKRLKNFFSDLVSEDDAIRKE